ncbi:MAG: 3-dehydroquinate synthase [Chthoniobacteraceae bacterium]|jgi:3-dehydroquinate synthase
MVTVSLGPRSYCVKIGAGVLESLGAEAKELGLGKRCAVVSDSNVAPLYGARVCASLREAGFLPVEITVPAGERAKSLEEAERICERMIEAGLDRKGWVVALGGGVIGDLAGFVAAIYYRGVAYVQAPTTIVAQVDSAVGGKTGVNARNGKNLIGAFHQPRLVIADTDTLATLPEREFNEGFAEVIKHGAIRDRGLLDAVAKLERGDLAEIIRRNVEIKARIVAADEQERTGERALLNFGHTIGHAIEAAAGYGRLLHGEAISLGLVAACRLSVAKAGLDPAEAERVIALLEQFHLPVRLPEGIGDEAILCALKADKKFEEGAIRFVLCPRLGEAFVSKDVTLEEVTGAIAGLRG